MLDFPETGGSQARHRRERVRFLQEVDSNMTSIESKPASESKPAPRSIRSP
jgi:hypothetical protein